MTGIPASLLIFSAWHKTSFLTEGGGCQEGVSASFSKFLLLKLKPISGNEKANYPIVTTTISQERLFIWGDVLEGRWHRAWKIGRENIFRGTLARLFLTDGNGNMCRAVRGKIQGSTTITPLFWLRVELLDPRFSQIFPHGKSGLFWQMHFSYFIYICSTCITQWNIYILYYINIL
jgi:hypothetical protein